MKPLQSMRTWAGLLGVLVVFLSPGPACGASVTFEAESGTLGSDWAVSNSSSPAYITITTGITGTGATNPTNASRVATYTVTFPAAGTYQLYARVRVGPDTWNDDSLFYGNGFGMKSPTTDSDWILVNGLGGAGYTNNTDVVTGDATALGSGMWKWVNLSQFTHQTGFTVSAGDLTQTFQIGGREDGLDMDKFVFGTANYTFTVSNLDNSTDGTPPSPPPPPTFPLAITNASGTSLVVGSNGVYIVSFVSPPWTFTGELATPLSNRGTGSGADAIGNYSEITFNYTNAAGHAAGIRVYDNSPVVLFSDTSLASGANDLAFPHLTTYPSGLNHISYGGTFAIYNFTSFNNDSPWLFFDTNFNSFVISPATNYMIAYDVRNGDGSISCGIDPAIGQLPANFTHRAILVAGQGINQTFGTWGAALTSLSGKTLPANDSAVELNKLGYWTDNGATYYYNYDGSKGYEGTLLAMRDEYASKGVPIAYLQLDSWWYPKGAAAAWNASGGIYLYQPDSTLFPDGLAAFQQQLGLPLITHARWIDPASPYQSNYVMSGGVCIDPAYWTNRMAFLKSSGVVTYEQDWLSYMGVPLQNLTDPPAYMNNMQSAAATNGLNLQYCMAWPRHYLQGSLYNNLLTIRTSGDRFETGKWDQFLYDSRLAGALGEWPWCDVFMSSETRNLLIATLSAGPVGPGDAEGAVDAANLMKVIRPDSVIVKPDVPIVPIDQTYLNDVQGLSAPMVAATWTDHGGMRALYVFAYARSSGNRNASFSPAQLGASSNAFVYNYFTGAGTVVSNGGAFDFTADTPDNTNGGSYFIVVPIGPSGIGLIGDTNKFVTLGKKRISSLSDTGLLRATVVFASGETNVTLCGYAPTNPFAFALAGSTNNLTYNSTTHRFTLDVSPDTSGTATIGLSLAPIPTPLITPISSGQFQISWPADAIGYTLEKTTNLAPPTIWSPVNGVVNLTNNQHVVTLTHSGPAAYYRLAQ